MSRAVPAQAAFVRLASLYMRSNVYFSCFSRRFRAHFCAPAKACARLWDMLIDRKENEYEPNHLLWALYFLKCYTFVDVMSSFVRADAKTVRKRTWIVVYELASLSSVCIVRSLRTISTSNYAS